MLRLARILVGITWDTTIKVGWQTYLDVTREESLLGPRTPVVAIWAETKKREKWKWENCTFIQQSSYSISFINSNKDRKRKAPDNLIGFYRPLTRICDACISRCNSQFSRLSSVLFCTKEKSNKFICREAAFATQCGRWLRINESSGKSMCARSRETGPKTFRDLKKTHMLFRKHDCNSLCCNNFKFFSRIFCEMWRWAIKFRVYGGEGKKNRFNDEFFGCTKACKLWLGSSGLIAGIAEAWWCEFCTRNFDDDRLMLKSLSPWRTRAGNNTLCAASWVVGWAVTAWNIKFGDEGICQPHLEKFIYM